MADNINCPFCGERLIETMKYTTDDGTNVIRAGCPSCGLSVEVRGTSPMDRLRALDDRMMPDGMTWPRWGDGKKVEFGDRLRTAGYDGEARTIQLNASGATFVNSIRLEKCARVIPDTQERIDADAKKDNVLDYWSNCQLYGSNGAGCVSCPHSVVNSGITCRANMTLDLLRRQRELDKREMCDGQN